MNEVIKQRLVGALILVALGVVFWPIIFVEKTGEGPQQTSRMPSRPAIDTSPIEPPSQAGLRASPELSWEEPVEETIAEPEAAETPVVARGSPAADTSAMDAILSSDRPADLANTSSLRVAVLTACARADSWASPLVDNSKRGGLI